MRTLWTKEETRSVEEGSKRWGEKAWLWDALKGSLEAGVVGSEDRLVGAGVREGLVGCCCCEKRRRVLLMEQRTERRRRC